MTNFVAWSRGACGALALLLLIGCSGSGNRVDVTGGTSAPQPRDVSTAGPRSADVSPSDSLSASSPTSETEAVLRQYRAFFEGQVPASKMTDETARLQYMRRIATDPALSRSMGGLAAATAAGQVLYGSPVLRPELQGISGDTATIFDCQDTSRNGRMVLATGATATVGRVNDYARVTLLRGIDGVWRVSTVEYAAAGSCSATA